MGAKQETHQGHDDSTYYAYRPVVRFIEVTVTRVKFSTGDEIDQPEHGLFMGVYVKARAVGDEQEVLDIVALVGGRLYEETFTVSTAFDPSLDVLPFNKGEQGFGWLVFDVPARHGQLVMRDLDEHKVGGLDLLIRLPRQGLRHLDRPHGAGQGAGA